MILKIYSVHDGAVGAFLQPFFARSNGEALRSFQDAINDEKHPFHAHVHDYHLLYLGTFDDGNGAVTPADPPERLLSGTEAIIKDLAPR